MKTINQRIKDLENEIYYLENKISLYQTRINNKKDLITYWKKSTEL